MSTYQSQYTGAQIDEAVANALAASDSGSGGLCYHYVLATVSSGSAGTVSHLGFSVVDTDPTPITLETLATRTSALLIPRFVSLFTSTSGTLARYPLLYVGKQGTSTFSLSYFDPTYTPTFYPSKTLAISAITSVSEWQ